jgi:hypothetical protein
MKVSSLRWPVLGLAVFILAAYALSKGVYAGSAINVSAREGPDKLLYSKSCHYLYFNGIHGTVGTETHSHDEAEKASCSPLETFP